MIPNQKPIVNQGERGNALFLILIAVALFAALSYAITQSGRGSGTVNKETSIVVSGQVVEEPAAVRTAVTRMIITGQGATGITFSHAASSADVFDTANGGGGATDVAPPSGACSVAADCAKWFYVPATSSSASGIFVTGLGTASTSADTANGGSAFAVLQGIDGAGTQAGVSSTICQQIQKGLGFASTTPPVGAGGPVVWKTPGAYAHAGSATTVADAGALLSGQAFACFQNTTAGNYAYYHALIEQ